MGNLNCTSGRNTGENFMYQAVKNVPKKRDVVIRKKEILQKLKEFLPMLQELDYYYNDASERHTIAVESLEGHESKDINGDANNDTIKQEEFGVIIDGLETFLKQFKETEKKYPSRVDFFTVLRSVLNMGRALLEEDLQLSDEINDNTTHGQSENITKNHKSKEGKNISKVQHQNSSAKEPDEHKNDVPDNVQLLYTQDGDTMNALLQELQQMLKRRIGSVNFIHLNEKSKIDDNMLLIIVCIVSTRYGADAKNAVEDIKNPGNVSLLLIHITEPHAVFKKNSKQHLTGQDFVHLQGIFDIYFNKRNGFLQCDMNDNSVDGLISFCKRRPYSEKL